jgi:hypothetical protein
MHGYRGTILRVNLTEQTIQKEALDLDMARKYIGGRGLGTKIMMDEVDPNVDPLSPENCVQNLNLPYYSGSYQPSDRTGIGWRGCSLRYRTE